MRPGRIFGIVITALVVPVFTGAIGNKLANLPWNGVQSFLNKLPASIWTAITWPIPVPAVCLAPLIIFVWWIWSKWLRLWRAEQARRLGEAEIVSMHSDNVSAGIRWRYQAKRGSPYPIISNLQRHCGECDAPLVALPEPPTPTSWMGDGSGRILKCPFGHINISTSYSWLEQEEDLAQAAAIHSATELFQEKTAR